MIADPDEPGYRYPQPGEFLWHTTWMRWVVIIGAPAGSWIEDSVDEVSAAWIIGEHAGQPNWCQGSVKLRSLEDIVTQLRAAGLTS